MTLREMIGSHTAGMTTGRWITKVAPRPVATGDLFPIQPETFALHGDSPSGDPVIHVVRIGECLWIEDGHHRFYRAVHEGRPWILARVFGA